MDLVQVLDHYFDPEEVDGEEEQRQMHQDLALYRQSLLGHLGLGEVLYAHCHLLVASVAVVAVHNSAELKDGDHDPDNLIQVDHDGVALNWTSDQASDRASDPVLKLPSKMPVMVKTEQTGWRLSAMYW